MGTLIVWCVVLCFLGNLWILDRVLKDEKEFGPTGSVTSSYVWMTLLFGFPLHIGGILFVFVIPMIFRETFRIGGERAVEHDAANGCDV